MRWSQGRGRGRTIRVGKSLFSFLEIVQLIHNLFYESFQFAHFCLNSRERLLIGDGAGGGRCQWTGQVERRETYL